MNKNKFFLSLLVLLAALGVGLLLFYPVRKELPLVSMEGNTMGTTYQVQIAGPLLDASAVTALQEKIDAELLAVNEAMSTYMPDSEISRFNRLPAGVWMPVGERFREVILRSAEIRELSGGAFDPSLGPLIDLWGFGAKEVGEAFPTPEQIEAAKMEMGFDQVELRGEELRKNLEGLEINLSAIAKGYGVDRVAALLRAEGYENIYVEIGGELRCTGVNAREIPWRIGIQVPRPAAAESALKILELNDAALATSGDYRNYSVSGGGLRHHILDPRTGAPATHTLASVSVLAGDCMTADAYATALMSMP
ncbi:MAG: FAD:protein FMN transferase, partial [Kiritimatiellia bacterium]